MPAGALHSSPAEIRPNLKFSAFPAAEILENASPVELEDRWGV